MVKYDVLEYIRPDGESPFADWLESLASTAAIKVAAVLHKMLQGWEEHRSINSRVTKKQQNMDIELAV